MKWVNDCKVLKINFRNAVKKTLSLLRRVPVAVLFGEMQGDQLAVCEKMGVIGYESFTKLLRAVSAEYSFFRLESDDLRVVYEE